MVFKSCTVIPEISIVILMVGIVVVLVSVAAVVVIGVDILPTGCVMRNVLFRVHNAGSMDIGAENTIWMVRSSPA